MALSKKERATIFAHIKDNKGKSFVSINDQQLKGGIVYKAYHEMISPETCSQEIAFIKIVFPDKTEIIISPLHELKKALKKSNAVGMVRYEFKEKLQDVSNYLYILRVGNYFFDLPEEMAKGLSKKLNLEIEQFPKNTILSKIRKIILSPP